MVSSRQVGSQTMNKPTPTLEISADLGFVWGCGHVMESLNARVMEIARTDIPVLIVGESGTGKEIYARLLHRLSGWGDLPLRKLSCPILDPIHLLQQIQDGGSKSEEKQPAGTLFLDAIDELDLACQRTLLSLIPDSQCHRTTTGNSMRLICSSVRQLEGDIDTGRFRKELYFRINGVCLQLPPLRERKEDIVVLLEHFLRKHAQDLEKTIPKMEQETIDTLIGYDWPGNIRELENLAWNMVTLGDSQMAVTNIRAKGTTPSHLPNVEKNLSLKSAAKAASREKERELILEALERTKWNRKRAAHELQISYKALLYKLKQIGASGTRTQN
jgi:two-component system, NtrC family, response regulator AtoC